MADSPPIVFSTDKISRFGRKGDETRQTWQAASQRLCRPLAHLYHTGVMFGENLANQNTRILYFFWTLISHVPCRTGIIGWPCGRMELSWGCVHCPGGSLARIGDFVQPRRGSAAGVRGRAVAADGGSSLTLMLSLIRLARSAGFQ